MRNKIWLFTLLERTRLKVGLPTSDNIIDDNASVVCPATLVLVDSRCSQVDFRYCQVAMISLLPNLGEFLSDVYSVATLTSRQP